MGSVHALMPDKDPENAKVNDLILQIIAEYMQEEHLLTKEELNRFKKIWRKGR